MENTDNPEDIVDKFRSVYSASYNSAQTEIYELWANLVIGNDACRMKPGKSDVSGGYTSKPLKSERHFVPDLSGTTAPLKIASGRRPHRKTTSEED